MGREPSLVLRWHVARLHAPRSPLLPSEEPRSSPEAWLELVVARAAETFPYEIMHDEAPVQGRTDRLDWWVTDEDELLHGWSTEAAIMEALGSSSRLLAGTGVLPVQRRVTEDMVFLQGALPPGAVADLRGQFDSQEALPDLSPLIELSDRWCDFTRPARRMAKAIYSRALKDIPHHPAEDVVGTGEGPHAAE